MPMTPGSVDRNSIDPTTGVASTGNGFALVLYDFIVSYNAALAPPVPRAAVSVGYTGAPFSPAVPATSADVTSMNNGRLAAFQNFADTANFVAQALVYIQGNASAHVTNQHLGNLPGTIAPGNPIDPPSSPVDIPIT